MKYCNLVYTFLEDKFINIFDNNELQFFVLDNPKELKNVD